MTPPEDGLAGRGDEVYEALLDAHAGLGEAESLALDARLVLLLANAVGNPDRVLAAISAARESIGRDEPGVRPKARA